MKDKIKNGYFFIYNGDKCLRVGSRVYFLPIEEKSIIYSHHFLYSYRYMMFKNIEERRIESVYKANGERVA